MNFLATTAALSKPNNMKFHIRSAFYTLGLIILMSACKTVDSGIISYDPPGRTTLDQPLDPHHKRTIGVSSTGVWTSNEFIGGRMNDFYHVEDNLYRVMIRPENTPINWSSWFSFKVWSEQEQSIEIELAYEDGYHRYHPVMSNDSYNWVELDTLFQYTHDKDAGTALLRLDVGPDTTWVSAQELFTAGHVYIWVDSLATSTFVNLATIGKSHLGADIVRLNINESGNPLAPMIIITGRQHPPEIPGSIAQKAFVETILSDDPVAMAFRSQYQVVAYPMMNPDGVDGGHWRHNHGGVDLNRDWRDFNQPETRAVSNDLLAMKASGIRAVYGLDFHSTVYDVFYTIRKDIPTNLPELSDRWLEGIAEILPTYEIREEPFGVASPVAKNWKHHTFGIGAVTYEVGDTTPRDLVREVAHAAAISLMRELIEVEL